MVLTKQERIEKQKKYTKEYNHLLTKYNTLFKELKGLKEEVVKTHSDDLLKHKLDSLETYLTTALIRVERELKVLWSIAEYHGCSRYDLEKTLPPLTGEC